MPAECQTNPNGRKHPRSPISSRKTLHSPPDLLIQAPTGRRDRGEQAEQILVALNTFLDHRTAYVFGVTAAGVQIDRYHPLDDENNYDEGYDPVWKAKMAANGNRWTAELWIPSSRVRLHAIDARVFGLSIHGYIPQLNEDDYWIPIPRTMVRSRIRAPTPLL